LQHKLLNMHPLVFHTLENLISENTHKYPKTRIRPYMEPLGALYNFFQNQILVVFSYYYYVKLEPKLFTLTKFEPIVNPESPTIGHLLLSTLTEKIYLRFLISNSSY
jgi:hypothetical protein